MLAVCLPALGLPAQWNTEELRERATGFLEDGQLARMQQIGTLLRDMDSARAAICASIHGDHREYLLKIERFLDQLADDRWLTREDAERTLIEIGGRALAQIEARAKGGATLEERIRADRIRNAIAARGTEAEENEIRLLRGFVATAAYMESTDRLVRALMSALGHTDPLVVEGAVRALGSVGDDRHAETIHARVRPDDARLGGVGLRRAALEALGRLRGARAVELAGELLNGGELERTEAVRLLRALRQRDDAGQVLQSLRSHADPVLAAIAGLEMPDGDLRDRPIVQLSLADRSELTRPLLGLLGDSIHIADPVEGMAEARIGLWECDVVEFEQPKESLAEGVTRVFLTQGSLIAGDLISADPEAIRLRSPVFGDLTIPRSKIQGLALDIGLDRLVGASNRFDRVRTRGGELVDGTVRAIGDGKLLLREDGEDRTIALDDVAGVLFQRPEVMPGDGQLFTRVDLTNGERLLAHVAWVGGDNAGLHVPGLGSAVVPTQRIARLEFGVGGGALWGFTLIADYSENRIIEVDDQGREVFALEEVYGAWDVECLDSGNLLITEFALNRIVEVTRGGEEVWVFERDADGNDLKNPYDADRLPNGNTLIADTFGGRVLEVDRDGQTVWEFTTDGLKPYDVNRLPDGNTLIADGRKERVLEVSPAGEIVWELPNMPSVHDVDRLSNGNTLITQRTLHRVIEVDRGGTIVFKIENLSSPSDADRLPNGHTIVAENGHVREFDRRGNLVWDREVAWAVEVNRY